MDGMDRWINTYDLEYQVGIRVLGWGMCLGKSQMINRISTTMTVVVVSNYQLTITVQTKIVLVILLHHISPTTRLRGRSFFLNQSKTIRSTFHFQRAMGQFQNLFNKSDYFAFCSCWRQKQRRKD